MKFKLAGLIWLALAIETALPAMAEGDDGLYEALPSPNSAFLRILNAGADSLGFEINVGGNTLAVGPQSVTSYVILTSGTVDLESPGVRQKVNIEAGKYYTYAVASGASKPTLFSDDNLQDLAKGRIYFYNLTGLGGVDLYVPAAKADALKDIAAGANKSVEVRAPLDVTMIARDGNDDLVSFDAVKIKRRGGTTLVLSGVAGNYAGFTAVNSVAKN